MGSIMDTETRPDEPSEPDEIEYEDDANFTDVCNWHMLKPIRKLLEAADQMGPCSPRVRFAIDQMAIAACECAARILRSDLEGDTG